MVNAGRRTRETTPLHASAQLTALGSPPVVDWKTTDPFADPRQSVSRESNTSSQFYRENRRVPKSRWSRVGDGDRLFATASKHFIYIFFFFIFFFHGKLILSLESSGKLPEL